MPLNINDLDYSLSELNIAIKDHYDWAAKILSLNLLGGEADEEIVHPDSHCHCRFSKWLKLRLEGEALDREMIALIDCQHTEMHDVARELMQSIMSKKVTEELVQHYHSTQQILIESLDRYKEYLFSYRNLHDALTGLPLRHLLYREFPLIRSKYNLSDSRVYVLIMDIDRFKSINDTWGHNAGDDVLRSVALALRAATRDNERIYRFGGEEFITLLIAKNDEDAGFAAERMRKHLESHSIKVAGVEISVTVTGGLTKVRAQDSLHEAIGRADKAMYYGKNTGRNRCIMSTIAEDLITLGE
ncbi:diguanylate cyclase [Buttiauxella sp. A111]|uniref:diguanylate cyclase n=1 Tax=Buttiauxella sp. A111 TaxID=2563088 RepID=UPI0010DD14A2|nr:diguanylate cyclase [Buttiauxella sp. A111]GDX05507.1 diguanylate cyclase [Buttiauxella sp. A111]